MQSNKEVERLYSVQKYIIDNFLSCNCSIVGESAIDYIKRECSKSQFKFSNFGKIHFFDKDSYPSTSDRIIISNPLIVFGKFTNDNIDEIYEIINEVCKSDHMTFNIKSRTSNSNRSINKAEITFDYKEHTKYNVNFYFVSSEISDYYSMYSVVCSTPNILSISRQKDKYLFLISNCSGFESINFNFLKLEQQRYLIKTIKDQEIKFYGVPDILSSELSKERRIEHRIYRLDLFLKCIQNKITISNMRDVQYYGKCQTCNRNQQTVIVHDPDKLVCLICTKRFLENSIINLEEKIQENIQLSLSETAANQRLEHITVAAYHEFKLECMCCNMNFQFL